MASAESFGALVPGYTNGQYQHLFNRIILFLTLKNLDLFWLIPVFDFSDEGSLPEKALPGASKLASTYFSLFFVHVLHTEIKNHFNASDFNFKITLFIFLYPFHVVCLILITNILKCNQ